MKKAKQTLGLYVHIPFCEKKCDYCDFLSGPTDKKNQKNYVDALLKEIKSYKEIMQEYLVKTIFIGGGTPSCIDGQYIHQILNAIDDSFSVEAEEVTIEANPGTLSREKLEIYKASNISRLSIGLQSTNNKELKLLGRIHTYEEFLDNYYLARDMGFSNINIDLMSGLPGQNLQDWEETLTKVIKLEPEHISAYSLIIEEGTPFYNRYYKEEEDERQEDIDRLIYSKTKEMLKEKGYKRYEVSNYSKTGFESKHNLSYWEMTSYLGLGLGASSLIKHTRFYKEEDIGEYINNSTNHKLLHKEVRKLTKDQLMEEFMFLGLRKTQGISKKRFEKEFGLPIEEVYGKVLDQSMEEGVIEEKESMVYLTDYGLDVSNVVLARFLL